MHPRFQCVFMDVLDVKYPMCVSLRPSETSRLSSYVQGPRVRTLYTTPPPTCDMSPTSTPPPDRKPLLRPTFERSRDTTPGPSGPTDCELRRGDSDLRGPMGDFRVGVGEKSDRWDKRIVGNTVGEIRCLSWINVIVSVTMDKM